MPETGLVDVPMKKWQDFGRREFGSVVCAHEGLPAVTKYRVLRHYYVPAVGKTKFWGEGRWFTLVQLRILTGRTHQIRVHMAFLGHPLVGDIKYGNPAFFNKDSALVPRIFLHCLRMEFEDMDGSTFVAASDLAADLQVALGRIQAMSTDPPASEEERSLDTTVSKLSVPEYLEAEKSAPVSKHITHGFYGLQGLLDDSTHNAPCYPEGGSDACGSLASPSTLVYRCDNCEQLERACCELKQRGDNRKALYWKLRKLVDRRERNQGKEHEKDRLEEPIVEDVHSLSWGPGCLWTPTEILDRKAEMKETQEDDVNFLKENFNAEES